MPAKTDTHANLIREKKAHIIAAMGHPLRLAIVEYLSAGEQCVCDIAEAIGAERPNVSRHLAVMLRAGLVCQRKDGLRMIYSLKRPYVMQFLGCVDTLLREQLTEASEALDLLRGGPSRSKREPQDRI